MNTIYIIVFVAIAIVMAVVGLSLYAGWRATHIKRNPLDGNPSDVGLTYEDVTFPALGDNVTLSGWFLPSHGSRATIVMAHGYGSNRLESGLPGLELARSFVDANFNVLMFDFRNSGESDGSITTLGYHEVKDISGAIAWLKDAQPQAAANIGLIGFSMGACTAVLAAAAEPSIDAIVIDSPFADLRHYLQSNMPLWTGLPYFPFTRLIMALIPPLIGVDIDLVSPVKAMPSLTQPTLIIHGIDDRLIPAMESEKLKAAGNPQTTKLWRVAGADHVGARQVDPRAYDKRVIAFFRDAFALRISPFP